MTELRISTGPDDPRLYEIDEDFRTILRSFAPVMFESRIKSRRFLHRTGTSTSGELEVTSWPLGDQHGFFQPGRRFPVVARFTNTTESDDVAPGIRGITLRLLDPAGSGPEAGLLNLAMNTGSTFFTPTAATNHRFSLCATDEDRWALARDVPRFRPALWGGYRTAVSYAEYRYYSQAVHAMETTDGQQWLVRYRATPAGDFVETGFYDPGALAFPPPLPGEMTRDPRDPRPADFLAQELRSRLRADALKFVLQVQLRPVTADASENERALDCTQPWPEQEYPWLDLGRITLDGEADQSVAGVIEGAQLNPLEAPVGLGSPLARSAHEHASLNHLRVLVYQMGAHARRRELLHPGLADVLEVDQDIFVADQLRTARAPQVQTPGQACPFSGGAVEEPPGRTVAVVGAGPAGLSIARELEKAGHRAIVLEALPSVGGKCESVDIDEHAYDLGGHVCTTQYENVAALAVELGVATEDTTQHRVFDIDTGDASPQSAAFFQREPFSRYAALRAAEFPDIAEAGLAHSAKALAQPVSQWLAENDLGALAESLGCGYTAAGYGFLAGDLPALYFVKYAEMTGLLSAKPELLGHTHSFTIAGGFMSLWEKVAAELSDVRCGVTITAIDRDGDAETGGVAIETTDGVVIADDLVITVPVDQLLDVLDATREERDLARRVRVMDYYTTVVSATGLPREAFYLVDEFTRPDAPVGDAVSFHHRYPDHDVYACYSYGGDTMTGEDVTARLKANIERMGGVMGDVHTQRRWKFLPHFGSDDVANGVYERIEELQGENHTFHAGSLPAYELVECNVAYARELVRRHFGGADDVDVEGHAVAVQEAPERPRPSFEALQDWLVEHIAAELQLPPEQVAPDARLDRFALESISVAALQAGLSDWLGFRIPHTLFLEHPTINAVANYLAPADDKPVHAEDDSALLLGFTAARPFFCVGGALGAAYYLLQLARDVGAARPFYGLCAPGYDGTSEPLDTVEALAARYIESIRSVQPYGPYLLGGHSFGGVVAYEMGRQLREAGQEVTRIVLLDSYVPEPGQDLPPVDDPAAIEELLTMNRLAFASGGPAGVEIDPSLAIKEQKERLGRFLGANGALPVDEHISNMLRVYQANLEANVKYQPGPSDLNVTLLKATNGFPPVMKPHRNTALKLDDPANGWEHVALGELSVEEIPGDHFTMFVEPNDELVAAAVHRCLAEEEHRSANTAVARTSAGESTVAFNPTDPNFLNDPYPFYRSLRESAPIHYEDTLGGWVFSRYDDVSAMLRNHDVIRPPVTDYLFASVPQTDRDEMATFEQQLAMTLPFTNAPYHTGLRKVISKAFTPRAIEAMRPRIQQITDGLLDRVEAAGGGDLISVVNYPLPSTVVMEFIGVPADDHARMTFLATEMMALLGAQYAEDAPAIARSANAAMQEYTEYMTALIAQRRAAPRDDLLSRLIVGGELTEEELVVNTMGLVNAGVETSANYLGNGTLALLRNPAQLRLLRENPSLAENAAEELLRYDGSTPILTPQQASVDVEIGGQLVKEGQLLYPMVGAANRDPARFPDPERLDLTRKPNGQLSFGFGIHYCVGAALAKIEGQEYFSRLAARFPNLRLDPDKPAPQFRDDPLLRGLTALHVLA